MKKIILISILITAFMSPLNSFAASGSILSPWKKSGVNVSLARSTDNVGIGETAPTSKLFIQSDSSTKKTLTLKMAASQSVNPFEIVDSTDVAKVTVASTGVATFANDVYANGNLYTGGLDYGINPGVVNVFSSSIDPNSVITTAHGYKFPVDGAPTALFQRLSKGDGTTDTPSATFVGALNYGASATGTDDYAITLPLAPLAYTTGMVVVCKADVICSGSCSLNVNTLGAKSLKVQYNIDPPDGYIKAGSIFIAIYDGTNFQIGFPILNNREMSYGVAWNETTDSYTRIGNASGFPVATTMPDTLLPVQANMKRCLLKDDGTINYFLYPSNSAFKVDGSTASVLTGADGQVMVRIPKFWYRYRYIAPVHYWEISPVALSDFDVYPAFIKDGVEVDYRYIGAYEGVLYDTSIAQYVDGLAQTAWSCTFALADSSITANSRTAPFKNLTIGQKLVVTGTSLNNGTVTVASLVSDTKITVAEVLVNETAAATVIGTQKDYTATTGDKLSSVSGFAPVTDFTRADSRVMGSNRGSGWRQLDYSLISAIQLLYLTEYASFYSQSMLGAGITNVADWSAYNDYNPIVRSGNSNSIGNATGNTAGSASAATEATKYLSYRGIENWLGHIWKFVDGFNINNNIPYMTNNAVSWADDTATNYSRPNNVLGTAITLINSDGYQNTLQSISEGFLPKTVGASSSTKLTDYYYQNTGWRVALFGGNSYDGVAAGGFSWLLTYSSADLDRNIGGRLSF